MQKYSLLDLDDEDARSLDTQTTESRTSVVVPLVQALAIPSVLSEESFRKKLYCVDVTVKLLMPLPAMFLRIIQNTHCKYNNPYSKPSKVSVLTGH